MQCVIQLIKDSSVCYNIINKVFIVWQIDANFPPCITKCPCPLFRFSLSWALITIKLLTGFTNLTTLDTSCKWNHVIFVLLWLLFHVFILLGVTITALYGMTVSFKTELYCIVCVLLYVAYPLIWIYIYIVSTLWLLWILMQWVWKYKYVFKILFATILNKTQKCILY